MRSAPGALLLLALLTVCLPSAGHAAGVFDHSLLDSVLSNYVDGQGRVDYAGLKAAPEPLTRYCQMLDRASPENRPGLFPTPSDSLAYWINAYNALVLKGVVDAYPVASVKDIKLFFGFFKRMRFAVGGRRMTLDDIEHGIIRKRFAEPRIHAAVNCGAVSCPKLRRAAYTAANLEAQLDLAVREFTGSEIHVRLDPEGGRVRVSRLFDWYGSDFTDWVSTVLGRKDATVLHYIAHYRDPGDRAFLEADPGPKIEYLDYDWALNDQATCGK